MRAGSALRLLLLLAGVGVVAYLVREVGADAVRDALAALGWGLALVLAFPVAVVVTVDALGWRLLLPAGVPFGVCLRARLAGEAVNLATPTASVGGEPLKAWLLSPRVALPLGLATVVVDKATVVLGQALFLLAGLVAAPALLALSDPLLWAMAALLAVEVLAVGGFVLVQTRGMLGGAGRLLGRLGMDPRYQAALEDVDRAVRALWGERRGRVLGSALCHAAAWALNGVEVYLVLALLGHPVPLGTALVIESFAAAVKFASFAVPASLGALEGGYLAIFGAFGVGGAAGLAYPLARRAREAVWVGLGLLALTTLRPRPATAPAAPGGRAT